MDNKNIPPFQQPTEPEIPLDERPADVEAVLQESLLDPDAVASESNPANAREDVTSADEQYAEKLATVEKTNKLLDILPEGSVGHAAVSRALTVMQADLQDFATRYGNPALRQLPGEDPRP